MYTTHKHVCEYGVEISGNLEFLTYYFLLFFAVLCIEPRVSHVLSRHSATKPYLHSKMLILAQCSLFSEIANPLELYVFRDIFESAKEIRPQRDYPALYRGGHYLSCHLLPSSPLFVLLFSPPASL